MHIECATVFFKWISGAAFPLGLYRSSFKRGGAGFSRLPDLCHYTASFSPRQRGLCRRPWALGSGRSWTQAPWWVREIICYRSRLHLDHRRALTLNRGFAGRRRTLQAGALHRSRLAELRFRLISVSVQDLLITRIFLEESPLRH
jgi:hypothetical protein